MLVIRVKEEKNILNESYKMVDEIYAKVKGDLDVFILHRLLYVKS